jgi:hypothetical protein
VWSAQRIPAAVNLSFQDWSCYFFIQVAPQLSSRGWVDPVPDQLLLRKSGSSRNRTRDLWICSQELWPLDHRGGLLHDNYKEQFSILIVVSIIWTKQIQTFLNLHNLFYLQLTTNQEPSFTSQMPPIIFCMPMGTDHSYFVHMSHSHSTHNSLHVHTRDS